MLCFSYPGFGIGIGEAHSWLDIETVFIAVWPFMPYCVTLIDGFL